MSVTNRLTPLISLLTLAGLLMPAMQARAASEAVITVDTTNDELINDGDCSLREAIYAANTDSNTYGCTAGSGNDRIIIPGGVYVLSLVNQAPNEGEDYDLTGDLDIRGNLVIQGAGREITIIDGGYINPSTYIDRVFHITGPFTVEIRHLTIQNGYAAIGLLGGGGILNQGTLALQDVSVRNNRAKNVGGGMDNYLGTATITNSSISGNISTQDGGGIFNDGTLSLFNSSLSGNTATTGGGGGLDNGDSAMMENVTISGNTSFKDGGGIFNDDTLSLSSSTLTGNTASNSGGGLGNWGITEMDNVTISGNTALEGGGLFNRIVLLVRYTTIVANTATAALGDKGGNIENIAGSIRMNTSIVANSLAGPNCHGSAIVSEGHNLENEDTCNFNGVGDLINRTDHGIDPLLTDNGGPTLTHALLQGSPAIDAGDDQYCPERDQRGAYRPADGDGIGDSVCDIGAFEYDGLFSKYIFVPVVSRW